MVGRTGRIKEMLKFLATDHAAANAFSRAFSALDPDFSGNVPAWTLNYAIPPEIIAEVKAEPTKGIFNVSATEVYANRILKCDNLVMNPGASLTMTALDSSVDDPTKNWCVIIARNFRFLAPDTTATIRRDPNLIADNGANGAHGSHGGPPGAHGAAGAPGATGGSRPLRTLYILGETMTNEPGNPLEYLNLMIDIAGIRGGNGGAGGNGGNGSKGSRGHDARWKHGRCKRSCGSGGSGGNGGPGMPGGTAGNGSDGADLIYGGPQSFLDLIVYSSVLNSGGIAGSPGAGGRGGNAGAGGDRGSHHRWCRDNCHAGPPGSKGSDGPDGGNGVDGAKGDQELSLHTDLNAFF